MSNEGAAVLFSRFVTRFEGVLWAARRNIVYKPAPLPTVNVHVGHVGEPYNGCHDGPAHCTAIGWIRWGQMSKHVPACVQSAACGAAGRPCVFWTGLQSEIIAIWVRSTCVRRTGVIFKQSISVNWAKSGVEVQLHIIFLNHFKIDNAFPRRSFNLLLKPQKSLPEIFAIIQNSRLKMRGFVLQWRM